MPHKQVKRDTSQLHGVPQFATGHMTRKGEIVVHRVLVTCLGAHALAVAEFVADHSQLQYFTHQEDNDHTQLLSKI